MADGGGQVPLNPTVDFVAGTVAGMASLVVGFPLDTVKVRFQDPVLSAKYKSTFHAITTIVREERFIGLFKGITSPLASVAIMNGLVFASYRFFMKLQLENVDSVPTITQVALAGIGSGIVSSIVTTPTDLIKIRQQSLLVRSSARKVALQIFREGGIRGLYCGIGVTALRDCGYGAYFATYEAACRYLSIPTSPDSTIHAQSDPHLSWSSLLLAGAIAGIAGWVATFPLDVVKTRMQGTQATEIQSPVAVGSKHLSTTPLLQAGRTSPQELNPFRTIWSTIVYSYRTEGLGVFFRGKIYILLRRIWVYIPLSPYDNWGQANLDYSAIPVNMVTFGAFEGVVKLLS